MLSCLGIEKNNLSHFFFLTPKLTKIEIIRNNKINSVDFDYENYVDFN